MEERKTQTALKPFRIRYLPDIRGRDADLIFEFFMVFSRLEYALKQAGYRTTQQGYLQPDWREFTRSTQAKFDPTVAPDLREAFRYYLEHPPRKQALVNDRLGWLPNHKNETESDYAWVIRSIQTVRNNLFHGGKFPWDAVRDTRLLEYGLIFLYHCMSLDDGVYRAFTEPS